MSRPSLPSNADYHKINQILREVESLAVDRREAIAHGVVGVAKVLNAQRSLVILFGNFHPMGIPTAIDGIPLPVKWTSESELALLQRWLYSKEFAMEPHVAVANRSDYSNETKSIVAGSRQVFTPREWEQVDEESTTRGIGGLADLLGACIRLPHKDRALGFSLHRMRGERTFSRREQSLLEYFTSELSWACRRGMLGLVMTSRDHLTCRQVKVMQLAQQGYSDSEIADELGVSWDHTKKLRQAAFHRLGISGGKNNLLGVLRSQANDGTPR